MRFGSNRIVLQTYVRQNILGMPTLYDEPGLAAPRALERLFARRMSEGINYITMQYYKSISKAHFQILQNLRAPLLTSASAVQAQPHRQTQIAGGKFLMPAMAMRHALHTGFAQALQTPISAAHLDPGQSVLAFPRCKHASLDIYDCMGLLRSEPQVSQLNLSQHDCHACQQNV